MSKNRLKWKAKLKRVDIWMLLKRLSEKKEPKWMEMEEPYQIFAIVGLCMKILSRSDLRVREDMGKNLIPMQLNLFKSVLAIASFTTMRRVM